MRPADLLSFTLLALHRQRFRSFMLLTAVALGVTAVVVLTALGEGARGYVLGEFSFLGKDTVVVLPGRKETTGGMPPMSGAAARPITLEEVSVIARNVAGLSSVAPIILGNESVSFDGRKRDSIVLGTTAGFIDIWKLSIGSGSNLPDDAMDESEPVAVIGKTLKQELFDNRRAIGQWVRLRDYRFRIVGILAGKGDSFGLDLTEAILIPVASAQAVFNSHGVYRVALKVDENHAVASVKEDVSQLMQQLHDGEQDVTLVSPDSMLSTFDDILKVLTVAVAGIGAISLFVSGILVMNVTLMSVKQRTAEIGLLKAVGAPAAQIRTLFLAEAGTIAGAGAALGIVVGQLIVLTGRALYPDVPFATPLWALIASIVLALGTALLFAWLPAQQAARLEPVDALTRK